MKINIKATGTDLTDGIKTAIESGLESFTKLLKNWAPEDSIIEVEVGKESKHHEKGDVFFAEVHFVFGANEIYAHSKASDVYSAIDDVGKECKRQFISLKEKTLTKKRNDGRAAKGQV